jgi:8-oxo-dGTP diphosphatase
VTVFDEQGRVLAAGGVVWRPGEEGVEVCLVHRPKYDDWTFPKGKVDPGESPEDAARREVAEETGLRCELGDELASATYVDAKGRPKLVRYWAMTPLEGSFTPNAEVDELRWVPPRDAAELLTYHHDLAVLESFVASPRDAAVHRRGRP